MNKILIVYAPGINKKFKSWEPLISGLKLDLENVQDFQNAEWVGWDHNCQIFSDIGAMKVAQRFCDWMDAKWFTAGGYEKVILIGHSMSGVIMRQAFLISAGAYKDRPSSDWWSKVDKFILLAALNRGVNTQQALIKVYDIVVNSLSFVLLGRKFLGQDLIFGSEFITDLRLQWMKFMNEIPKEERPDVVQILGQDDGIVSREDSIDIEQFPNAYHIPIPEVNHADLPLMNRGKHSDLRFQIIRDAILGRNLADHAENRQIVEKKQNVIFILHGIRASNRGWVSKLADLAAKEFPDAEVISSSYGYLSALEFFIPFLHIRPLRWFHTKYADYYASNPEANFFFVGHSNGTYILGRSLLALRGMHFNKIILAGSVLPADYPWREIYKRGQYKELRNDQANADFPVGFLCSGLHGLGRKDIGTGGYEGFQDDDNSVIQYAFHPGDHGAALVDSNLTNFIDFLKYGAASSKPSNLTEENPKFSLISRMSPWIFRLFLLSLLALILFSIISHSWFIALATIGIILVVALILKVL